MFQWWAWAIQRGTMVPSTPVRNVSGFFDSIMGLIAKFHFFFYTNYSSGSQILSRKEKQGEWKLGTVL